MNDAVHPTPRHCGPGYALYHDDCMSILPKLPAASVDAVICDPIYPGIDRNYGRITEGRWMAMMKMVVGDIRRLLKPSGSAVFILQPNSERIGRSRVWLWEFMAWVGREWNLIEDVYWWNSASLPNAGCERKNGLLRRSMKTCVWAGSPGCFRDQDAILWGESEWNVEQRARERSGRKNSVSGNGRDRAKISGAAIERGGVTPFNILVVPATGNTSRGNHGHSAATPYRVCDWWVRYISPPGGVVLDPFTGSSTVGIAALANGRTFIGIDKDIASMECSKQRLQSPEAT